MYVPHRRYGESFEVLRRAVVEAPIGGLYFRHVGGQHKRKFTHIVCIKMAEDKNLIITVHQYGCHDINCKPSMQRNAMLIYLVPALLPIDSKGAFD